MADINTTISDYQTACKAASHDPSNLIMTVLNKEKELVQGRTEAGVQPAICMKLYLAGNNKLIQAGRLGDNDMEVLYKTLANNLYVTSLDLRYNAITDAGIEHVAKLIKETATLKELNLMNNDFEELGAHHLAQALLNNETIVSLKVNGNKFGNKGGMEFAGMLQVNTTLEHLDLGESDLTTESLIAIATVLNYNTTLKYLNVNRPILFSHQEETTVHFAKMLKENRGLKELHLMKCDIRDFGMTRLSENLICNFTLTYLNLSCNRITRDGMKELAKCLKQNTPLEVLDLGFNRIEDDGAIYLADALATYNTTLKSLCITSNQIKGKGLCAIARCLQMNSSLDSIYIWGNVLEESACRAFAQLIETGRIEPKDTDVESYVVDGVIYLSELPHGLRRTYYCGDYYGEDAQPELAMFVK